jgi:hypothetical protein
VLVNEKCNSMAFVHIEAESDADMIHYLWNFQDTKPSAVVARTSKNATLNINWEKFDGKSKAFNFSEPPLYVYSSVINSIFVYNDTWDKGDINDASVTEIIKFDTQIITWSLINITSHAGNNKVTADVHASTRNNGSFRLMVCALFLLPLFTFYQILIIVILF